LFDVGYFWDMKQIQDFAEQLNLTKTDIYHNTSFIYDCVFWQTKYPYVYITDYDLNGNNNSLIEKGIVTIFYKYQGLFLSRMISFEMFNDIDMINQIINNFHLETLKLKELRELIR